MNADLMRFIALCAASPTYGFAIANLVISFQVLRPRPFTWKNFGGNGGGFIWLHIVCVVIPFQGFVTWGIVEVNQRFEDPATWRAPLLTFLCVFISIGYVIIFRVEMARLQLMRSKRISSETVE